VRRFTNLMFLAVVPLQEIATAPSDRIESLAAIYFESGTLIIAVMIMISTLLVTTD
jgi:APA family basic amino acid/polyamine antiporter